VLGFGLESVRLGLGSSISIRYCANLLYCYISVGNWNEISPKLLEKWGENVSVHVIFPKFSINASYIFNFFRNFQCKFRKIFAIANTFYSEPLKYFHWLRNNLQSQGDIAESVINGRVLLPPKSPQGEKQLWSTWNRNTQMTWEKPKRQRQSPRTPTSYPGSFHYDPSGKSLGTRLPALKQVKGSRSSMSNYGQIDLD
jgi:hypothetical protein